MVQCTHVQQPSLMQLTIDTSAIIAVITNETSKSKIVNAAKDCNLCAPKSVHWEIGNAFSAMFKRSRLSIEQAKACLASYQQIPIKFLDVSLAQTLDLSHQCNIYAYDAYLIQCAQQTSTALLTLDHQLQSVAKSVGVSIQEI